MKRCFLVGALLLTLAATEAVAQRNTFSFPDTSGRTRDELVIPLRANFRDPVTGVAITVLFDPNVVRITSVSLTAATANFNLETRIASGRLQVALASTAFLTGNNAIVNLTVRLIGPPGTASVLDIASTTVNEGTLTSGGTDGRITIVREARMVGGVFYYDRLRPVGDAVVQAVDAVSGQVWSTVTDASGGYVLGPMPVGDYRLSASKQQTSYPAISAVDVSDILRYIVGAIELSVDQRRSADVNNNGQVGTTDASLILRYLVGLETSFPAGAFWQFQPTEQRLALLEDGFRNFTGVLLGDVNGDWQGGPPAGKRVAVDGPVLGFAGEPCGEPRSACFALSGADLGSLLAGELLLVYDPADLQATAVRKGQLTADFLLAANLEEPGQIRIAMASASGVAGAGDLLHFEFAETGTPGTATSLELRSAALNGSPVGGESLFTYAHAIGSRAPVTAVTGAEAAQPGVASLGPNYPNPFNSATVLTYRIAARGPVDLAVYSVTGQRVRQLTAGDHPAGEYAVRWDGTDDRGGAAAAGVYLVRLRAGAFADTRRIMLLK